MNLVHCQFETIHLFFGGNGKIGRFMVNLFLKEKRLLSYPTLYISYFLKRNRFEYYDRLTEVREKGNFEQWVKFFLRGIYESAEDAIETRDALTALRDKNLAVIIKGDTRTGRLKRLFSLVEQMPIIAIKQTAIALGSAYNITSTPRHQKDKIFLFGKALSFICIFI